MFAQFLKPKAKGKKKKLIQRRRAAFSNLRHHLPTKENTFLANCHFIYFLLSMMHLITLVS